MRPMKFGAAINLYLDSHVLVMKQDGQVQRKRCHKSYSNRDDLVDEVVSHDRLSQTERLHKTVATNEFLSNFREFIPR